MIDKNIIGAHFNNTINKCFNYFFMTKNTLVCKSFVMKFVIFLISLFIYYVIEIHQLYSTPH